MSAKRIPLQNEMSKNPELNKQDLDIFRDWSNKQPHLPPVEDEDLVLILHSCYYRLEPAKVTLDTYFTVRTHIPEFFSKRDINRKEVKHVTLATAMSPLPDTTPNGHKVIFCKLMDLDASKFNVMDNFKVFNMVMDLLLYEEGTAAGHVIIFDMSGMSLSHLARLSLVAFKKFFFYLQEAMPVRLKGLHFINVVSFMDKIMAMMTPFLKKELLEVMHLHTAKIDTLYQYVPQNILPADYGGKAPPLKTLHEMTLPRMIANQKWFQEEETRRVVEAKRPGKAKTAGDLFGMEGSFKKLEID